MRLDRRGDADVRGRCDLELQRHVRGRAALTGSFSVEPDAPEFVFPIGSATVVGLFATPAGAFSVYTDAEGKVSPGGVGFSSDSGSINIQFLGLFDEQTFNLQQVASSELIADRTSYRVGDTRVFLRSGTISLAPPAVPEPATWAAMIAGFALVGTTMRRRARVSYTLA